MPPISNAFIPGESAQIADEDHLREVLAAYRNGPEMLRKLRPHIGQRFRIVSCSFPHGAGVLYELSGIEGGVWQECLLDWTIREDDETCVRASQIYTASAVTEAGQTFVVITDRQGRVFAKLHRSSPAGAIAQINEIASLRSRAPFEARFGFNGDYTSKRD